MTIRQNGYIINQRYVPPGAFTINDLYPTAASGDLTVEVKESDGSINRYNVPYSAVPILQREGRLKYAATVAEYRSESSQKEKVKFSQATLIWGLPHGFTLYGGTQLSSHYHALAIGSGANLGDWGAVSLDVTQATSTLADNNTYQGQSLRFLYAKSLAQSGTNLQLMGYRYSTSGFYTLDDTTWKRMSGYDDDSRTDSDKSRPEWADYYNLYYTRRGKVQLDINQQLGGLGSLFITGSQQSYWHTDEKDSLLQVGYSDTLAGIAWSVSYNNNKSAGDAERDQIFALNISVPLSQWLQHDDESRAITMFTLPLAPVRTNSITLRRMRALAAHCWTKTILVTTYSKVIRITVLAKAAPPGWNTMARKATPTLAITLAITAITSR